MTASLISFASDALDILEREEGRTCPLPTIQANFWAEEVMRILTFSSGSLKNHLELSLTIMVEREPGLNSPWRLVLTETTDEGYREACGELGGAEHSRFHLSFGSDYGRMLRAIQQGAELISSRERT